MKFVYRQNNTFNLLFLLALTAMITTKTHAYLGLPRAAYGIWDREGLHDRKLYPYANGQSIDLSWAAIEPTRNTYDWTDLDLRIENAYSQNQYVCPKISPIDQSAPGGTMPSWMFGTY
jgi:hypothetical protein